MQHHITLALLVLVLRMGHVGKGAQRWIDFGGTLRALIRAAGISVEDFLDLL